MLAESLFLLAILSLALFVLPWTEKAQDETLDACKAVGETARAIICRK